mgnify:CR=1 FL=1
MVKEIIDLFYSKWLKYEVFEKWEDIQACGKYFFLFFQTVPHKYN